jgi:hypothetical protein
MAIKAKMKIKIKIKKNRRRLNRSHNLKNKKFNRLSFQIMEESN